MTRLNRHEKRLVFWVVLFLTAVLLASSMGCKAVDTGPGRGTSVDIDTDRSKPRKGRR